MPENYKYGGGATESLLSPIVIVLTLLAIACVLAAPRKYVSLPLLWMVLLVPLGQQIYIAGVHLFVLRLVILFGLIRMSTSRKGADGQLLRGGLNGIDRAFLICVALQAAAVMLLYHVGPAVINQISYIWDWAGGYLVIRWALQDEEDVYRSLKYLALLIVPVAIGMIIEQIKMVNVFGFLGGIGMTPSVRDGKIRSNGIFAHPIIAGTVGGVLMPLFLLLWKSGKSRILGTCGVICATIMMWTSHSSTCIMAYAGGLFALLCWPLRKSMKEVRWGIVLGLIGLQLVMKAPVWFLIARVDLTGGSSSYHRAELIDQFIRHFSDWWLIGVADSSGWGLDMWDAQNQYVNIGEGGGLLALVFFILVISRSFGRIGTARRSVNGDNDREWMFWIVGSTLFANVVAFFGVNYFDQSRMCLFLFLAIISALTSPGSAKPPKSVDAAPALQRPADAFEFHPALEEVFR